jgi:hypothetical protein
MKEYNGHRSWNAWNVSLWLNNDEGLYNLCMEALKECGSVKKATYRVLNYLEGERTPDGAIYTPLAVKLALASMQS